MNANPFHVSVGANRNRVVVASPDLLLAEGLAALLVRDARWEVFAIVRSIDAVLSLGQSADFGVLLIDANMVLAGGEAFRARLQQLPFAPVVIALASGGRVLARVRTLQSDRLIAVSHDAPVGSWLSVLSARLSDGGSNGVVTGAERASFDVLTPAQKEVFLRMVKGETVGAIAKSVGRSPKTISSHKSAAQRALGVTSLGGLIRFAVRNKLISLHDAEAELHTSALEGDEQDHPELMVA